MRRLLVVAVVVGIKCVEDELDVSTLETSSESKAYFKKEVALDDSCRAS